MTRPASAPLLLLAGIVAVWTLGRVGIIAWDDHLATGRSLPPPLLSPPGLPSAILLPPLAAAAPIARPHLERQAPRQPSRGRARDPMGSLVPPSGANDQFAHVQSVLLNTMLRAGRLYSARRSQTMTMARFADQSGVDTDGFIPAAATQPIPRPGRMSPWSAASWALYRSGNGSPLLARQGRLGASQAGLRIAYQIDQSRAAELFGRLTSSPAGRGSGEAAFGLSVRPEPAIPAALVVERRQRLSGTDARSAFAAYVTGGGEAALPAGLSLDLYGAAGIVGLNRRDLFAETAVRTTRTIARAGPVSISAGGAMWGAVQPGASRLDAGPTVITRLPGTATFAPRIAVDYRRRVAGQSEPGSGIAITLSADF